MERKQPPNLDEKMQHVSTRSLRPGAVAVPSEAVARLDQRIDRAKSSNTLLANAQLNELRPTTTADNTTSNSSNMQQLESDILSKQRGRVVSMSSDGAKIVSPVARVRSGAFSSSELTSTESKRSLGNGVVHVYDFNASSRQQDGGAAATAGGLASLRHLDSQISAKSLSDSTATASGVGGRVRQQQRLGVVQEGDHGISATNSNSGGEGAEGLRNLDDRIAAKTGADGRLRMSGASDDNDGDRKPAALQSLRNLDAQVSSKSLTDGGRRLAIQEESGHSQASSTSNRRTMTAPSMQLRAQESLRNLDAQIASKNAAATAAASVPGIGHHGSVAVHESKLSSAAGALDASDPVFGDATSKLNESDEAQLHQQAKESGMYTDLLLNTQAQSGGMRNSNGREEFGNDLEFGLDGQHLMGNDPNSGLAVATMVDEDDEDAFVPSAVEYDPDAKPPLFRNRRFRLYAGLVVLAAVLGVAGAIVGFVVQSSTIDTAPALSDRATIGLRETIAHVVVGAKEHLDDFSNPYRKALDWIQDVDSMALSIDSPNLIQRYLLAYFYYSTSTLRPWADDCRATVLADGDTESNECEHVSVNRNAVDKSTPTTSMRWLSPVGECTWAGIRCDSTGQVVGIELTSANMTGSFPEGIVGLVYLQTLILFRGELTGSLPPSLANIQHLSTIVLTGNQLSGTVPDSWYGLNSLIELDVSSNQVVGSLSAKVGQWKDMTRFAVSENRMTGTLPKELGDLLSVAHLRFNDNEFRGSLPSSLGNLQKNNELWFQRNLLTGSIPSEIGLCTDMTDIRLHANSGMNGSIPESLYGLSGLGTLDLFDNQFTGTLSTLVGNWLDLAYLRIENNMFSSSLPTELGQLLYLQELTASGNNFEGAVPNKVCRLKNKKELRELQVDCLVSPNGTAEIQCPVDCCTLCCDADGGLCQAV